MAMPDATFSADFGKTSEDYATHRAGFPPLLFERLQALGIGGPGQRILDLGSGTGTLARGFAERGGQVTATDISPQMLAAGADLAAAAGLEIEFREAPAEKTGLPDNRFDLVAAGQCWHWFDRPAAAAEARRLLKPGGRLLIAHFDWLPLAGNMVALTESLIVARNPAWNMDGGRGVYPQWFADVGEGGFQTIESFTFDETVPYSHEAWRGRIRASAGVGGSMSPDEVAAFDAELATQLSAAFPEDPLLVPHRCFALTAVAP